VKKKEEVGRNLMYIFFFAGRRFWNRQKEKYMEFQFENKLHWSLSS